MLVNASFRVLLIFDKPSRLLTTSGKNRYETNPAGLPLSKDADVLLYSDIRKRASLNALRSSFVVDQLVASLTTVWDSSTFIRSAISIA